MVPPSQKASSFKEAKKYLTTKDFDIAVLDIIGVKGFELLDLDVKRDVIAVILNAHALSPDDTVKCYRKGAASYVPKHEASNIVTYLNDILEAREEGKSL